MNHPFQGISMQNIKRFSQDEVLAYLYGSIKIGEQKVPLCHSYQENTKNSSQCFYTQTSISSDLFTCHKSLPSSLKIEKQSVGNLRHISVITKIEIRGGTHLGSFDGIKIYSSEIKSKPINSYTTWKVCLFLTVFKAIHNGEFLFLVDGDSNELNWLKFISRARNPLENNIDVRYDPFSDRIYFLANKNIGVNEELIAWYQFDSWIAYLCSNRSQNLSQNNFTSLNIQQTNNAEPKNINASKNETDEYVCEKCGSVFSYPFYLERHKKYTACADNINRTFVCTICQRTFEKNERLRVHIKQVHDKIRPYKCPVNYLYKSKDCGKEFSQSSSLTKHKRIHSGSRPYVCSVCHKEFTASSILTTHMRQHTGERPFKCPICKKGFASHAAHHSHVRRTHGLEPKDVKKKYIDGLK